MVHENLPMEMSPEWKAITKCESRIEALEKTLERHGEMLVEDEDRYDKLESVLKKHLKAHLKIGELQHEEMDGDELLEYWDEELRKQLQKLSGEKDGMPVVLTPSASACKENDGERRHPFNQSIDHSKPESDVIPMNAEKNTTNDNPTHKLITCSKCNYKWLIAKEDLRFPNEVIISRELFERIKNFVFDPIIFFEDGDKIYSELKEKSPEPSYGDADDIEVLNPFMRKLLKIQQQKDIAEFIQKLKDLPIHHYKRPMAYVSDISNLIDEYEAKLK